MPLKNYTSQGKNTFDVIQKCLASHGAQKLMFDYNSQGQVIALSFGMEVEGILLSLSIERRLSPLAMRLQIKSPNSGVKEDGRPNFVCPASFRLFGSSAVSGVGWRLSRLRRAPEIGRAHV